MKNIVLVFFLFLSFGKVGAQSIQKIEILDDIHLNIIKDYIDDCRNRNAFYGNKGIIHLTETLSKGTKEYSLSVHIDDTYKDNPPHEFGYVIHTISYLVVFYKGFERQPLLNDKNQYLALLNYEVGDRVYSRPEKRGRWALCLDRKTGKVDWGFCTQEFFPNGNFNSVTYRINPDGTFKKLRGA